MRGIARGCQAPAAGGKNAGGRARVFADFKTEPSNFQALYQLGLILFQYRQFADANRLLAAATQINPDLAELCYNRGCVFQELGRHEDALAAFARALSIAPDFPAARNNRGVTLLSLGRPEEALACFDRVLKQHPQFAMVHNNRATALLALKRFEEALAASDASLRLEQLPDAFFSRGSALAALERHTEALSCFEQALVQEPQHANALVYSGILLERLNRPAEALDSYDAALVLRPGDCDILFNRTSALAELGRFDEVVAGCDQVLGLDPHFKYAEGSRLFAKLQCCDWENLASLKQAALAHQRAGFRVFQPIQAIAMFDSGEDLQDCSRIWVTNEFPPSAAPLWSGERFGHDRICIAYVSGDFGFHPVMLLAAGMFERHDRSRFELTAISTGPDDGSDLRRRLEASFDRFIDMQNRSAGEIARHIRELQIDIAVDLMGFTKNATAGVFAQRPAGIQVSFLGFPGTTGAPYFDYIIADRFVAPGDNQQFFNEKIIRLPHSCMPNDNGRQIGKKPSREEAGLPENGFVFCNFGKAYKITPEIFAVWMRLLSQTPESVLWLRASGVQVHTFRRNGSSCRPVKRDCWLLAVAGTDEVLPDPLLRKDSRTSINVRAAFLHVLGDALATIGVIVGGVVIILTGFTEVDVVVASLIGLLILGGGVRVVRESLRIVLEQTPKEVRLRELTSEMAKVEGVKSVHDVHVWSLTSGMNMMSCHVDVDEHQRDHVVLEALKEVARRYGITHTTIQIEHHEDHENSVDVDFKKD